MDWIARKGLSEVHETFLSLNLAMTLEQETSPLKKTIPRNCL